MRLLLLLSVLALAFTHTNNFNNFTRANISVEESSNKEANVQQRSNQEANAEIVKVTDMLDREEGNGKQTNEKSSNLSRKLKSNYEKDN